MLEKFDVVRGKVVGDRTNSTRVISVDGENLEMRTATPLLVGTRGLFTVKGFNINADGVIYRVEPDSIDYEVA